MTFLVRCFTPARNVGHTLLFEPGAAPPFCLLYRISPHNLEEAKLQIVEYQKRFGLNLVRSPYGAPIICHEKERTYVHVCLL